MFTFKNRNKIKKAIHTFNVPTPFFVFLCSRKLLFRKKHKQNSRTRATITGPLVNNNYQNQLNANTALQNLSNNLKKEVKNGEIRIIKIISLINKFGKPLRPLFLFQNPLSLLNQSEALISLLQLQDKSPVRVL